MVSLQDHFVSAVIPVTASGFSEQEQSALPDQSVMNNRLPRHVAIIMDGNGRWAKQRGKSRIAGHRAGIKAVHRAIRFAVKQQLPVLTLYAFSRDNWRRPAQEVDALMKLFFQLLERHLVYLNRYHIRLQVIGDRQAFSAALQEKIQRTEEATADKQGLRLNIAANYSGHWDITQAVSQIVQQVLQKNIALEKINASLIADYLCLHEMPAVDLLIRTSGEYRISNFLLWQIAYAELYFTECLWPDFDDKIFQLALETFTKRERRFGGVDSVLYQEK